MKIKIPNKYAKTLKALDNIEFYYAGGFLRDIIIKRKIKDIDIITKENIKYISKLLNRKPYLINERFNTARFYMNDFFIDVNTFENTLKNDAQKRDFTINSLISNKNGNILDYFDSIKDIKRKIIRPVTEDSIPEDALRILRAIRFAYAFNFHFAKGLKKIIKENAYRLNNISKERVFVELEQIFSINNRGKIFRLLYNLNILMVLIPELNTTEKFNHKKYKSLYLINHLFNTAEAIDLIINNIKNTTLLKYARKNILILYFAALFHDIEKPALMKRKGGKLYFFGHDVKSADTAKIILKRLRFKNYYIDIITKLISMHMRPHMLVGNHKVSNKGFYRLYRDSGNDFEGLIILAMADKYASDGIIDNNYVKLFNKIKHIDKQIKNKKINFITGKDILNTFNLKPGKQIGMLITKGNEYAIANKVTDKKIILEYLKQFI